MYYPQEFCAPRKNPAVLWARERFCCCWPVTGAARHRPCGGALDGPPAKFGRHHRAALPCDDAKAGHERRLQLNQEAQMRKPPAPSCETRPGRSESRRFNAYGRVRRELFSWNSYLIVGVISAGRRVTSYGNTIYSDRAACRNGSPLSAYSPKAAR